MVTPLTPMHMRKSSTDPGEDLDRVLLSTNPARVERVVVEDLYTMHLSQNLETFETGGVDVVRGDLTVFRARSEERGLNVTVIRATGSRDGESARHGLGRASSKSGGTNGGAEHVLGRERRASGCCERRG